jgi:hypothetical protein
MSVLRINQKHFKGNTVEQIRRSPYPAMQILPETMESEGEQERGSDGGAAGRDRARGLSLLRPRSAAQVDEGSFPHPHVHPLGENCECNNYAGRNQSLEKGHFLRSRLIVLGLLILMSLLSWW